VNRRISRPCKESLWGEGNWLAADLQISPAGCYIGIRDDAWGVYLGSVGEHGCISRGDSSKHQAEARVHGAPEFESKELKE